MDEEEDDFYPPEYVAAAKAQAVALKPQAAEHGLRFESYLVPGIAEWVLDRVEKGDFHNPSEAVFVAMQVFMELEGHHDLRRELFRREIQKRMDDLRPGIPAEEVFARLKEKMAQESIPAQWVKIPYPA